MSKKYSDKWKTMQQQLHGGWAQRDPETGEWRRHYIKSDTEYRGEFLGWNAREANAEIKKSPYAPA